MERKKLNVILTVEESEELKQFCIEHNIKWFRTECGSDRYFEVKVNEEEEQMIEHVLAEFRRREANEKICNSGI